MNETEERSVQRAGSPYQKPTLSVNFNFVNSASYGIFIIGYFSVLMVIELFMVTNNRTQSYLTILENLYMKSK